ERTDVLISHVATRLSGDRDDEEIELSIDANQNRIDVRGNPHAGTGWAGIAGDVDLDAVVGQITRAFRRGGAWAPAKPSTTRFGGRHAWSDITVEVPWGISGRVQVHSASGDIRIEDV